MNLLDRLKNIPTTVAAIVLMISSVLAASQIVTIPVTIQQAAVLVIVTIVGLVSNGWKDWDTNLIAVIPAACAVLQFFGVFNEIVGNYMVTLSLFVVGILAHRSSDLPTTIPAVLAAVFGLLSAVNIAIPPAAVNATNTIVVIVIAFLTGGELPLPLPLPGQPAPQPGTQAALTN